MLSTALALTFSFAPAVCLQEAEVNEWTVMLYGAGDNSSEESLLPDIEDLRQALPGATGLEFVCLLDRSSEFSDTKEGVGADFHDTRLYAFEGSEARRVSGGAEFPEIGIDSAYEANMGAPETLGKFIRWAKAYHPAKNYALIFYSHGGGFSWCPDDANQGDRLYSAEITTYLDDTDGVDLMVFDVCLMGGVENCYEWRPGNGGFYADVMVATPNAGFPFPWQRILSHVRPNSAEAGMLDPAAMTARDFGSLVVRETLAARKAMEARHPEHMKSEAQGCYDLKFAKPVKQAFDGLARALAADDSADALKRLGDISDGALNYAYVEGRVDRQLPYFDAFDLCARIRSGEHFGAEVKRHASLAQAAIEQLVVSSFGMRHYPDFQPGKNGVYVILPSAEPNSWTNCSWLSPNMANEGEHFGNYAWCRDGSKPGNGEVDNWFELLDALLDEGPAPGGSNAFDY